MIINLPKVGNVSFDDNISQEELDTKVGLLAKKYGFAPPPKSKPEMGLGRIAANAGMRTLGQMGVATGDILPAMYGSAMGSPNYAKRQMEEAKASYADLERKYPTRFKSFREVEGPRQGLEYAAETFGELGPQIAGSLVPGVGGGVLGARVAGSLAAKKVGDLAATRTAGYLTARKGAEDAAREAADKATALITAEQAAKAYAARVGTKEANEAVAAAVSKRVAGQEAAAAAMDRIAKTGFSPAKAELFTQRATQQATKAATQKGRRAGMYGGVYLGSLAQTAPEVFEGIYRETGKFEPGLAALTGGINAVLDSVVPGQLMKSLGPYGRQKLTAEIAKNSGAAPKVLKTIGGAVAGTATKEGLTEAAQEAIGAQAERIAGSLKDIFHPENIARYQESFVKGAIGGGGIGTVSGTADYFHQRGQAKAIQEGEAATQAQQQEVAAQQQEMAQATQEATAARTGVRENEYRDLLSSAPKQLYDKNVIADKRAELATMDPDTGLSNEKKREIAQLENEYTRRYGYENVKAESEIEEMERVLSTLPKGGKEHKALLKQITERKKTLTKGFGAVEPDIQVTPTGEYQQAFASVDDLNIKLTELEQLKEAFRNTPTGDPKRRHILNNIEAAEDAIGRLYGRENVPKAAAAQTPTEVPQEAAPYALAVTEGAPDISKLEGLAGIQEELNQPPVPGQPAEGVEAYQEPELPKTRPADRSNAALQARIDALGLEGLDLEGLGITPGSQTAPAPAPAQPAPVQPAQIEPTPQMQEVPVEQVPEAPVEQPNVVPIKRGGAKKKTPAPQTGERRAVEWANRINFISELDTDGLSRVLREMGETSDAIKNGTRNKADFTDQEAASLAVTIADKFSNVIHERAVGIAFGKVKRSRGRKKTTGEEGLTEEVQNKQSIESLVRNYPDSAVKNVLTSLKNKESSIESLVKSYPNASIQDVLALLKNKEPSIESLVKNYPDALIQDVLALLKNKGSAAEKEVKKAANRERQVKQREAAAARKKAEAPKPTETKAEPVVKEEKKAGTPAPKTSQKPAPANKTDGQKITELADRTDRKKMLPEEKAAHTYFNGYTSTDEALNAIASDIGEGQHAYRGEPGKEGQGGENATLARMWVENNLSPGVSKDLTRDVEKYKEQAAKAKTANEQLHAGGGESAAKRGLTNVKPDIFNLFASEEASALHATPHDAVTHALKSGDFAGALRALLKNPSSPNAAKIAKVILDKIGNSVKVNYDREVKRSSYDPATNTINLREGASEYEILHEGAHAVLSHVIQNKNHPVTRQLQNIFDSLKGSLDGTYGATDLQEFVAEAWSNPEFQKLLSETPSPKDPNRSLWDRLVDALRSLFGYPQRVPSTFDKVDSLLHEIASTPPDTRLGTSMYAQAVHQRDLANRIQDGLNKTIKSLPMMTPDRADRFLGATEWVPKNVMKGLYKTLHLHAFSHVAGKTFGKDARDFADQVNLKNGYQGKIAAKILPTHQELQKYSRTAEYQTWSTLVHDSTRADVNPQAPASKYAKNPEKAAQHSALQARFNKLSKQGKELYSELFKIYKELGEEFRGVLENNVMNAIEDKKIAASAYQRIIDELAKSRVDHYAPLYRKGMYWLSYTNKNGEEVKQLFETRARLTTEKDKQKAAGSKDIKAYSRVDQITGANVPDNTLISSMVKILKDSGADDEAITQLAQAIVKTFPETSMLKSFQHREGTLGYLDDAAFAFSNVTSSMIHQLSKMKYRPILKDILKNMGDTVNELEDEAGFRAKQQFAEYQDRYKFVMDPNISDLAQYASTGSFYYNLAGNVSSAVVNTFAMPMVVLPQLGGEYGFTDAMKAMKDATAEYMSSGFNRNVTSITGKTTNEKAMLSVENKINEGKLPEYKKLFERLVDDGFLQISTAREAISNAETVTSGITSSNRLAYYTQLYGTFMFHHAERMNREVTAIAAYNLELNKLKGDKNLTQDQKVEQAITKAVRSIEYMHGAGHTDTAPSIGHNDLGKVLMVFKNYAFNQYYMLFNTMARANPFNDLTRKEKLVAQRQLVGVFGMAGIFAGAKGMPLYWIVQMAYDMFADDDEEKFDAQFRRFIGEIPFKGPVNYFTNLGIADRVGWTDLIYREARSDKSDAGAFSQVLESLGGAPYTIINNIFYRAKELASDGHWERAVETFLPVALRNPLKGVRYAMEGANTLRGDPVMGEINGYNAAAQILGFAPADLLKQYEENSYLKARKEAVEGGKKSLLNRYYTAYRSGDEDLAEELKDELFAFGEKHPTMNITQDTINRSVKARDRRSEEMAETHGIHVPKWLKESHDEANSQW